jgi:hypothetical protein
MIAAIVGEPVPNLIVTIWIGHVGAAQLLPTAGGNPERLRSEAASHRCAAWSGKTVGHRLNRGGDGAANSALKSSPSDVNQSENQGPCCSAARGRAFQTRRHSSAKLRQQASVEDIDYRAARGLDRALFQSTPRATGSTLTTLRHPQALLPRRSPLLCSSRRTQAQPRRGRAPGPSSRSARCHPDRVGVVMNLQSATFGAGTDVRDRRAQSIMDVRAVPKDDEPIGRRTYFCCP